MDRRNTGAVVYYLRRGEMQVLDVPGVSGENVKDFLVSRDGSRLVAVVRNETGTDSIVVSRILTAGDGQVVQALPAREITEPETRPTRSATSPGTPRPASSCSSRSAR